MSEINETIRLAMEVVSTLEHDAEMFDASRCGESASVCRKEAAAIRELVALHTETCELLTEIAKDYDHPWPKEDRETEAHRIRMCVAIRKRLTEIAAKQEQGKKEE